MPVRFHRSIKLFPGFRLNLSKSGIGASVGPKGMRMSVGKRGIRTTESLLGTGVSFIQQSGNSGNVHTTEPIPVTTQNPEKARQNKKNCLWIALILLAIPIIVVSCILATGGSTDERTATPTIIATQPTTITIATAGTSTPMPTTDGLSSSKCACEKNYNCSDFSTHDQAQACFTSCGGTASYNWSNLDGTDHDGNVCESLP